MALGAKVWSGTGPPSASPLETNQQVVACGRSGALPRPRQPERYLRESESDVEPLRYSQAEFFAEKFELDEPNGANQTRTQVRRRKRVLERRLRQERASLWRLRSSERIFKCLRR